MLSGGADWDGYANKVPSATSAKHHRVQAAGGFDQAGAHGWMQTWEWMPWRVAGNDPAFFHQGFAGKQTTLAVLVINQRKPAFIGGKRIFVASGHIGIDDLTDAVRVAAAGHGPGGPSLEIC